MAKISTLIVDDHTMFRQGLRSLLESESDIEVVGEAGTGLEAISLVEGTRPDVVILDITMPDMNGLHAAAQIHRLHPNVKVIILSMSDDEEFVKQSVQVGVKGYLVKQTAASDLIAAIREVFAGNAFFSPSVSKVLLDLQDHHRDKSVLSLRESEVLQLVVAGKPNREISKLLSISIKTVEKHRQQIMDKLGIHDVANLTRYAIRKGLVK